ncbi:hypothetical protein N8500_10605 [Candidatus Puniceispirillum sp.]|nr:hypothetical protein [Candidatus Puniceispirillum sp.]
MQTSMERLSSGLRINSAADAAAGWNTLACTLSSPIASSCIWNHWSSSCLERI